MYCARVRERAQCAAGARSNRASDDVPMMPPLILAIAIVGATIIALRKGGTAAAELRLAAIVAAVIVALFLALACLSELSKDSRLG
jgi:hypothetical protein